MIDVGDLVGLIFAVAFALISLAMIWLLLRLRRTVDELTKLVAGITDQTVPLLGEVTGTVVHVNDQLVRVDAITGNVQAITTNAKALSGLFAATLGGPMVKVAALSYGVRRAAGKRHETDVRKRVKAEMKAEKKRS
ncbi:MAG TPA: DUF948 domain-containing protein [Mycobacteriales bacterium]|nr:DUF948 domain-containing protein [Mycobacteriales bacterium]